MKRSMTLAALFLLTACAVSNVERDYVLGERKTEGLAVVSLSHEGIGNGERVTWFYRSLDGNYADRLLSSNLRDSLDWDSPQGRLAYFSLPPGRYEFHGCGFVRQSANSMPSWHIDPGNIATINNPSYAGFESLRYASLDAKPFSVQFEILPGKVTYVGNLHFVWSDSAAQGKVVVFDKADRDLSLLKQRLPNLQLTQIRREN